MYFKISEKDWENFILRKRKYLLTTDNNVSYGCTKCIVSNGTIAELFVTDIVRLKAFSSDIYVVTAEVNQIWL